MDVEKIIELRAQGLTFTKIAQQAGVSPTTICRRLEKVADCEQLSKRDRRRMEKNFMRRIHKLKARLKVVQ